MATAATVSGIDEVLAKHGRSRADLIPILQELQDAVGYLDPADLDRIAEHLGLSPNDVFGVATFYTQFRFHPPGKHHTKVCLGTACHVRGGSRIMEELSRKLGIGSGETTEDRQHSLERVACFGSCALAPVVVVDDKVHGRMSPKKTTKLIESLEK
jgi:NADH-quinone oxidoreductase subunit E